MSRSVTPSRGQTKESQLGRRSPFDQEADLFATLTWPTDEAPSPLAGTGPVAPPHDDEIYAYMGSQSRWFTVLMATCYALVMGSLLLFSLRSWAVWVFIGLFAVLLADSLLSLLTGTRKARYTKQSHLALLEARAGQVTGSVDVFLPTCGEPLDLLANTYRYVREMRWNDDLRVHVLDDADRPEVELLARGHGFNYIVRPDRGHLKKAGNLRHACRVTDGDYIVIFDADFCPRPDFLDHLMPYFDDLTVGIVQSPQAFDTNATMSWIQRTAGATQEYFYRWVQRSRDAIGAPICVGTCAVYSRAALDASGGIAAIEHSEDIYTGLQLAHNGYSTSYVPILLAKGLCPDTADGFVNQQYRWCMGSISLLMSPDFHRTPMTRWQRMAYWSGFFYYVSGAFNTLLAQLPGLVMLAFFAPDVSPASYLPLFASMWLWMVLAPLIFHTNMRYEFMRVQMLSAFTHAVALVDGLRGRAAAWVPTGAVGTAEAGESAGRKGARLDLSARVAILGVGTIGFLLVGLVLATTRAIATYGFADYWMAIVITAVFAYLALPVAAVLLPLLPMPSAWKRTRRSRREPAGEPSFEDGHQMKWPIALAISSMFLLLGLIATGLVNSALSIL